MTTEHGLRRVRGGGLLRRESSRVRAADSVRSLVGFSVGNGFYAVGVPSVREIVFPGKLVEVPQSSSIVLGVTDHRGRVVPIVDLRLRFGLESAQRTRKQKWIVVEDNGHWLGLVVDGVTEVFAVSTENERASPALGPDEVARGFARVYKYEDNLVFELDLPTLVKAVEKSTSAIALPSLIPGSEIE